MVLHRLLADKHLLSHFLVLETLRDQRYDFPLALAQWRALAIARRGGHGGWRRRWRRILGCHELPNDRGRRVRIEPDLAGVNFADTLDQQLRRGLLQHDPGRA